MGEDSTLVSVKEIRREFETPSEPLVVLDGASFELAAGASLAIMGPSGCGKSTLLQIVGTLDRPTSGSVEIGGVDPFTLAPNDLANFRNEKVGFIFQDHHLLPQCTVLENVLIPTLVGAPRDGDAVEARARELLEQVGLSDRLDHRPAQLSGGERQRVAVARSMINSPILLLCDEPTGNLDRKSAESIGELFTKIQSDGETCLVVVTHSADFARNFDRLSILIDGKLEGSESSPASP